MNVTPLSVQAGLIETLLAGNKTQARTRAFLNGAGHVREPGGHRRWHPEDPNAVLAAPGGQPGDLLWVRETTLRVEEHGYAGPVYFASPQGQAAIEHGLSPSPDDPAEVDPHEIKFRPSTQMPRYWSRITLELTRVRLERLQSITDEDCRAEGIVLGAHKIDAPNEAAIDESPWKTAFRSLWSATTRRPEDRWTVNPWVWIYEFQPYLVPVEEVLRAGVLPAEAAILPSQRS